ncbi:MAG: membrane integrity-associated transporter subunit PqiC [Propionivibrio sp.]|uniref:Membrane integrity-associated transporter subunit PqiC n=1 Tax=Candidatus Propionivibrio dominans TaxID=2954373 RepID=A0A9D7F4U6_9RHOO|nr:membrane integrity-associated transporter subunit PqiC [Candidatus Propionivibrio dominans]MBL0166124.1 membrane integrity-associated transporter subunit PqiC [Propionivibrio sp.]
MKSRLLVTVGLLALLLSACSSSPKTSYYTLSAAPAPSAPVTSTGTSVIVGPVSLPESVDQALLVVQNGSNQVSMNEFHRWAGSLKGDISRVIAANLAHDLGTTRVWSYAQSTQTKADYQVLIDVQTFDARLGEVVVLDVLWTIRPSASNAASMTPAKTGGKPAGTTPAATPGLPISGRTLVREAVSGAGYEPLVAAQSRALMQVSADIARAMR